jgi:hypothetical protein
MARLKSHYRKFAAGGAVVADTPPAPPVAIIDIDRNDVADDDASLAFRKQIEALRESERIQRERASAAPPLTKNQASFIQNYPGFLHDRQIAMKALSEAHGQGLIEDSPEFHSAVKSHFERLTGKPLQTPSPVIEASPSPTPTTEVFEPPEPRSSSFVSAPVSRDVPSSNYDERRPGTIRLSVEEKEMARRLDMSEADYARGLLEMRARDKEFGRTTHSIIPRARAKPLSSDG